MIIEIGKISEVTQNTMTGEGLDHVHFSYIA